MSSLPPDAATEEKRRLTADDGIARVPADLGSGSPACVRILPC